MALVEPYCAAMRYAIARLAEKAQAEGFFSGGDVQDLTGLTVAGIGYPSVGLDARASEAGLSPHVRVDRILRLLLSGKGRRRLAVLQRCGGCDQGSTLGAGKQAPTTKLQRSEIQRSDADAL